MFTVEELLACKKERKNSVHTYCDSKDRDLLSVEWKVVMRCHESPVGIEELAISHEITN